MPKKSNAPSPATAPCAICAGSMKHTRTIPAAGIMRELHSFICSVCGCPRTEEGQAAVDAPEAVRYAA